MHLSNVQASFKAALDGEFREAKEKLVRMPEADVEAFAVFAQWSYGSQLVWSESEDAETNESYKGKRDLMIRTYINANQLGSQALENQVIDEYLRLLIKKNQLPSPSNIRLAYEHLPEHSMLRKMMVDDWVRYMKANSLKRDIH